MVYLIISAIIAYVLRTFIMYFGSARMRRINRKRNTGFSAKVSVIVPARNEESNIKSCIEALLKSNYPNELFEIILVNDRSEDSTLKIMQETSADRPNVKILNLTEQRTEKNMLGKPGALHLGIEQASGDIILMTDADCTVDKDWIATISNAYQDNQLGLQASYTLIAGNRIFDIIQSVEWIYMHTMAAAGMAFKQPLGCYGNNLSVRKSVYDKLGGYPNIQFSVTEDLALEQSVFAAGYKLNYLTDHKATVITLPCKNFTEYISQHRRWAIGGIGLGWRAAIFVITSLLLWIGLIISIIALNPLWIFALIFTRLAGDYAVIAPAASILKQKHLLPWVLPSVFFFMFIELIIPFTLISRKVKWKGQIFKS